MTETSPGLYLTGSLWFWILAGIGGGTGNRDLLETATLPENLPTPSPWPCLTLKRPSQERSGSEPRGEISRVGLQSRTSSSFSGFQKILRKSDSSRTPMKKDVRLFVYESKDCKSMNSLCMVGPRRLERRTCRL